jgi:hypothetical protein
MLSAALLSGLLFHMAQNPSALTEQTRTHDRVAQQAVKGRRNGRALTIGHPGATSPVILHFHGETWLPEQSIASVYPDCTIIAIYLGDNSDPYRDAHKTPRALEALLTEAGARRRPVILTSFSAGYGAIRSILRHSYRRIDSILLMDGLHTDYLNREVNPAELDVFLQFAKDASLGRKRMLITHSEVYPGAFSSTKETADWLLRQLHLRRLPVIRTGPGGMQQTSEVHHGRLVILGFAGDTAPDHVDHFFGMATWLRALRRL